MSEDKKNHGAQAASDRIEPITDNPTVYNNACDTCDHKSKMGIVLDNTKPVLAVKNPESIATYERKNSGSKYPFEMGQLVAMHNRDTGKVTFHGTADTGGMPNAMIDIRFGNGSLNSGIVSKDSSGRVLTGKSSDKGVHSDNSVNMDFYIIGEIKNSKGQLWSEAWAERRASGNNAHANGYDKASSARLKAAENGVQEIRDQMEARLAEFAAINKLPSNEERLAAASGVSDNLYPEAEIQLAQNLGTEPLPSRPEAKEQMVAENDAESVAPKPDAKPEQPEVQKEPQVETMTLAQAMQHRRDVGNYAVKNPKEAGVWDKVEEANALIAEAKVNGYAVVKGNNAATEVEEPNPVIVADNDEVKESSKQSPTPEPQAHQKISEKPNNVNELIVRHDVDYSSLRSKVGRMASKGVSMDDVLDSGDKYGLDQSEVDFLTEMSEMQEDQLGRAKKHQNGKVDMWDAVAVTGHARDNLEKINKEVMETAQQEMENVGNLSDNGKDGADAALAMNQQQQEVAAARA